MPPIAKIGSKFIFLAISFGSPVSTMQFALTLAIYCMIFSVLLLKFRMPSWHLLTFLYLIFFCSCLLFVEFAKTAQGEEQLQQQQNKLKTEVFFIFLLLNTPESPLSRIAWVLSKQQQVLTSCWSSVFAGIKVRRATSTCTNFVLFCLWL